MSDLPATQQWAGRHGSTPSGGAYPGQLASQYAPGQYGAGQYEADQYTADQFGADPYGAGQPDGAPVPGLASAAMSDAMLAGTPPIAFGPIAPGLASPGLAGPGLAGSPGAGPVPHGPPQASFTPSGMVPAGPVPPGAASAHSVPGGPVPAGARPLGAPPLVGGPGGVPDGAAAEAVPGGVAMLSLTQLAATQRAATQRAADQFAADQFAASEPGTAHPGTTHPGTAELGTAQLGTAQPGSTQSGPGRLLRPAPDIAPGAATALPSWDPRAERGPAETPARATGPWLDICDQFGLHLLVLAEQLRTSLDELEADEADPERLRRLYQVDHAVTRMRRASRDLRTLAGRSEEELAGFTTSLLDIIRMAASAIERYTQVSVGRVTDLAVLGYAADDVGALMAALLDNATRYSPGTVTVSGHLIDDGGVMFRIEDTGIGIGPDQVDTLNATLAGPVPDVDERTGRHTGFPVVHRIARKHSIVVRLATRPQPSSGTVAMVTLPPHLLCEVPAEEPQRRPGPPAAAAQPAARRAAVTELSRGTALTRPHQPQPWEPPEPPGPAFRRTGELPRRERASLRGDERRSWPREQAGPTLEQQSTARRAFADELSAFSRGASGDAGRADAAETALEEDAKP